MGISSGVYWSSIFFHQFLLHLPGIIMATLAFSCIRFFEIFLDILGFFEVPFFLLLAANLLFLIGFIVTAFLLSSLVHSYPLYASLQLGSACIPLFIQTHYRPSGEDMPVWASIISTFWSTSSIYQTISAFIACNSHSEKCYSMNISKEGLSLLGTVLFSAAGIIFRLLFFCYISSVFPGEYGHAQSWYFFVMPSYWLERNGKSPKTKIVVSDEKLEVYFLF